MTSQENGKDKDKVNKESPSPTPAESGAIEKRSEPVTDLDELKNQAERFKNEYLYLKAEFDTYRRNVIKERADQTKYGSERLLVELLNVLDNFERANITKATPENLSVFVKGLEMTASEFRNVLQKFGILEVPCVLGTAFDPTAHEALGSEVTDGFQAGSVIRVLRKPYKLHEKLIRPAQVVVARAPEAKGE